MLCHGIVCTIDIKLQKIKTDDQRIVGGNYIPMLRIFPTIKLTIKTKKRELTKRVRPYFKIDK